MKSERKRHQPAHKEPAPFRNHDEPGEWCLAPCPHGGVCLAAKGHSGLHATYGLANPARVLCSWGKKTL